MKRSLHSRRGFTLVELLVVIAIIGLLVSLLTPSITRAFQQAQSTVCAAHLSAIGVGVNQAATDNNGQYPEIDTAAAPIYSGPPAQSLLATLTPYGITAANLQCPNDISSGASSSYTKYGSSYEWAPTLDDESLSAPVAYTRGQVIPVNASRVRLCMDFNPVHRGKNNALYADGHVRLR